MQELTMNHYGGDGAATEEKGPYEPQEMITGRPSPPPLLASATAAEHSDEEEGLEPWEVGLGHCGGYEATEGPYVLQEMITDEPPPPQPPLEPAAAAEHGDELEEQDLEPWEVVLGNCEAAEGPYVLQEMITDEPPPPQPPLEPAAAAEHGDELEEQDLEPWEVVLGNCEAAEGPYVLQEMITGRPLPPPLLEPAAAAEHSDEDLEPWEIEPEPETGARRYPEEMAPG